MRYTQPQFSTPIINTRALLFHWNGATPDYPYWQLASGTSLLKPVKLNQSGGAIRGAVSRNGVGISNTPTASSFGFLDSSGGQTGIEIPANSDFTCLITIDSIDCTVSGNPGFWRNDATSQGSTFFIGNGTTRRPWVRLDGIDILQPSSGPQWSTGGRYTFILRVKNGASADVWWDGVKQHSATHTTWVPAMAGSTGGIYNFGKQSSPSENITGNWLQIAFWTRHISDWEAAQFSTNPWQLFKSPQRILLASAGGPSTYSYTGTGGYVFSGITPSIRSRLKTPAGGLNLAGTTPVIRGAVRVPTGGLSTGGTSTVLRGLVRAASGGVLFSGVAGKSFFAAVQSLTVVASGGLILAGAATKIRGIARSVTGGLIFGGSSATTLTPDPNPTTKRNFKRGRRPRTKT